MGCHVQIECADKRPKSDWIRVLLIIHIVRSTALISIAFVSAGANPLLIGIGLVEFIIGWWLWNLKFEAWGIAVGFSFMHIALPFSSVSVTGFPIVILCSLFELLILGIVRTEGYYSFSELAKFDPAEVREPTTLQKRVFQLVVVAQLIKTTFLLQGMLTVISYGGLDTLYGWIIPIPDIPIVITLIIVNFIAAIAFYSGRDWGFHLILILAGLSLFETIVSYSAFVILIAIWIILLLRMCIPKDGFYPKLLARVRKDTI